MPALSRIGLVFEPDAPTAAVDEAIGAAPLTLGPAWFRALCDASPVGMFATDAAGRCLYTNARWRQIHALQADAALGDGWLARVHPADRQHVQRAFTVQPGGSDAGELPCRLVQDGRRTRELQLRRQPVTGQGGAVVAFVGTVDDVTDRTEAEHLLRDERRRLRWILEGTGTATWEWNVQTGELRVNERWADMLGHTLADLAPVTAQTWTDHSHPDDAARCGELLRAHFSGLKPGYQAEVRMRHRDGHWVWLLTRGRVLTRTATGEPEWMFGTHFDLTVRKQQEDALRKSEAFLNRTGEVAGIGGWELDLVAKRLQWSPQTRRLLGVADDHEPLFDEASSLYLPHAVPLIEAAKERAIHEGKDWDLELPLRRADGRQIWVRVVGHAEFEGGRAVRLIGALQDITDRVQQRRVADRASERLGLAADSGAIGIWEYESARKCFHFDAWCAAAYGMPAQAVDMAFTDWVSRVHRADRDALKQASAAALDHDVVMDVEFRIDLPDGSLRHLRATARRTTDAETGAVRLVGATWDVTPLRQLSQQLAEQHELLRVTLESIGDGVLTTDASGCVTWLNPVAERLSGWAAADATGRPVGDVLCLLDDGSRAPADDPVAACLAGGHPSDPGQRLLVSRSGQEYGIAESAAPIRNAAGKVLGAVLVFHDVTEQRRLVGEMSYRAKHDALTGLINRTEFEAHLRRSLQESANGDGVHALLYIDLDQFKLVNDACGHAVGDQLLQQVSHLLTDSVRSTDMLARLGGDEFAVILEHCSVEQAERVAQAICERMDAFRFTHDDRRFRIGTSIGLVPLDRGWSAPSAVMQAADSACYAAKDAGRNRVHTWLDDDLALRARSGETQWATRIEQALDEHRFALFAQRITPIADDVVAAGLHAEVLVRLVDTDGSLVPPGAFLPAAERFHLSSRLDRWVLRSACAWLTAQLGTPAAPRIDTLCVNLSGQSIGDRAFHRLALDILAEAGPAACHCLCLEITETAAVTNLADAALFIDQVHRLGVRIALDDFGAGAASFGYLKSLSVDVLKIDGQFVKNMLDDPLDDVAVRCFVDVARVLGLKTVAEFVDSPQVLARLREIGVDCAQGFLLHRPEPIDRLGAPQTLVKDAAAA